MDHVTDIEPARIDDLLSAYRELQSQFDRVLEQVRRADEHKQTVQRRIYDRVRAEYDRELDSIRARMSPIRDEIDRMHEALEAQWRDASSTVAAVEEELSEAEFRHRIGEYEVHAFDNLRISLDARAEEARSRRAVLQAAMDAIAAMRRPDPTGAPDEAGNAPQSPELTKEIHEGFDITPDYDGAAAAELADPEATPSLELAVHAPVPEPAMHTPLPASAVEASDSSHRPVLSVAGIAQTPRGDGFENPHDWIAEMGSDTARQERRVHLSAPTPPSARSSTTSDELDSLFAPEPVRAPNLPSLVFVSGPHAGQSIALLPTTLTIGREHDNNVEIKDPDVARYHARILRERNDYVVEDLNSSTGTWVNGERQKRAVLTHGDVIRVGRTELALDFEWTTDSRQDN